MHKANKFISSLLVTSIAMTFPLFAMAEQFQLNEGSSLRLKLLDEISSGRNHEGDSVSFQVLDDVTSSDGKTVVVKAGTPAWGNVSNVKEKGMAGEKGEISFTVNGTKAIDGTKVPLRASVNRDGQGKLGTVVALSLIITPLFLLMHGKDAKIPAGTQVTAYVDRDVLVTVAPIVNTTVTATVTPQQTTTGVTADYLQKYEPDAVQSLEKLYKQGLLTKEEFEAKKLQALKK